MRLHMSARVLLVIGAIVGATGSALGQKPFEGTIDATMHTQMGELNATYFLKDARMRTDMSMGTGIRTSMIVDPAAHRMYMLMPTRQMYMEREMPDSLLQSAGQQAANNKVTWTGRTETIAGVSCEHATATANDGSQLDMCIAKGIDFGGRAMMMGRRGAAGDSWQQHVEGGFPLRVQRVGDSTPLFEVTKVERKAVGDDLFTPPAGWQKMTMPMMGPMDRP